MVLESHRHASVRVALQGGENDVHDAHDVHGDDGHDARDALNDHTFSCNACA